MKYLILILFVMVSYFSYSQTCGEFTVNEMRKFYKKGQFENIISLNIDCSQKGFKSKKLEEESLGILSKTYLELGRDEEARQAIINILTLNPNFEPASNDPEQFKLIVSQLKESRQKTMVESVSKKNEKIEEAPATVMVITTEDIKNRGYTDIEQIFSDLPGFDVSHTYGIVYSNLYQRGYRSDNTERTLFLVDGVEDSDLWTNVALISLQYSISNIKQIEIVYGPASTMYGANAVVGVVNIITKEPEDIAQKNIIVNKEHQSFLGKNKKIGAVGAKFDAGYGSFNTKYADLVLSGKKGNVSFVTTLRKFDSEIMDLSGFEDFDYNVDDFDKVNYKDLLSVYDNAAEFVKKHNINEDNLFYNMMYSESGDTTGLVLTSHGAEIARNSDKKLFLDGYEGKKIEYSNLSEQIFFYGKLKIDNLSMGYQVWRYLQGMTNQYGDYNRGPVHVGNVWEQSHSFFYAKYTKSISEKLELINFAQYRITKAGDASHSTLFRNYANQGLAASSLLEGKTPYWYDYYVYQISRQFRNEFKAIYQPNTKFDMVSGIEVKNSIIQGDYRISYVDTLSVIESGVSSGDALPGGNSFNIKDFGIYIQGSYRFSKLLRISLGGRYDFNRIRVTGGYESQFNPRIALIFTPKSFIFKAIYATAFQNASNWKKFSTTLYRKLNNPTLAPERVRNFEFSAAYASNKSFYADVVFYNSFYEGVVGTGVVYLNGAYTQQNQAIGELKIHGVQSTLNYTTKLFGAYANYSYTYPLNNKIEEGKLTDDFQRIADIAEHKFNIGLNVRPLDYLNLNLRYNYVGKRPVGEGTSVSTNPGRFPAHSVLNGAAMLMFKRTSLQLTCNNIFNIKYFDPGIRSADGKSYAYRSPQKGRVFMLRLIYELK